MESKHIMKLAHNSGIKERTLYRAAEFIGVTMVSGGLEKPWRWHLCPISRAGKEFIKERGRDCSLRELWEHLRIAGKGAAKSRLSLESLQALLTESLTLPGAMEDWTVRQALDAREVRHAN